MFFSLVKSDGVFHGMETVIKDRIASTLLNKGATIPDDMIEKFVARGEINGNDKSLGLTMKHCMVGWVDSSSPLKGLVQTADIIICLNGIVAQFDKNSQSTVDEQEVEKDKVVAPKSPHKLRLFARKKTSKEKSQLHSMTKTYGSGEKTGRNFSALVREILKNETKIEIGLVRLKTRFQCNTVPKGIEIDQGHLTDIAVVYQYKHLKLGLNAQMFNKRLMVAYTTPDTSSHVALEVGETIHAVDDVHVKNLEELKKTMLDGCAKKNYVKLLIDYPVSDVLKNMIRNQLAQAGKECDWPSYFIPYDVRKFAEVGIKTFEDSPDPISILAEDGIPDAKYEKKVSQMNKPDSKKGIGFKKKFHFAHINKKATTPSGSLNFKTTTDEMDVPTEHNSKLFVALPPAKSVETETPATTPTPPENTNK